MRARPGLVYETDRRTPPVLFHYGEGFRLETLPAGSRIVYPPEPVPALRDERGAIARALDEPFEMEPLRALLRPDMKLTIAFDDISLPLPQMRQPDIRQLVIEQVVQLAAEAGVEDVELIVAQSLHRKMTPAEIRRAVGDRVFRAFWPERLRNFDAEDPDDLVFVGTTDHGEEVELCKRAMESDLLVYVNINLVAMDGGHKSVPVGLGTYRSLRHHHNVKTLLDSNSYMDPRHSALHRSTERMGRFLADKLKIFHIETTLNNEAFPAPYDFLSKRAFEWSFRDQATYLALSSGLKRMKPATKRKLFHSIEAPHRMTSVQAGQTDAVHAETLRNVHRQQLVPVQGQTDILTMGIPYVGPYNVNSVLNPILVVCMGLGYFFNLYRGAPLVRPGGVVILAHPTEREFHPTHHPSYIDFFDRVLAETTDPAEIEKRFEADFASDPWYRHLYRNSYAYHGVHPFYMWYWAAHAMDHLGDAIFLGGDPKTVRRLGFRSASTLDDALEMAKQTVGLHPSITHLHCPPLFLPEVTP
ncbi:MAG TPA: lactate racemase domain-containing protein [Actinomycetota bacterium]|nr:lactate racemase domain-containing protein [Actinomycetota bacterium]